MFLSRELDCSGIPAEVSKEVFPFLVMAVILPCKGRCLIQLQLTDGRYKRFQRITLHGVDRPHVLLHDIMQVTKLLTVAVF